MIKIIRDDDFTIDEDCRLAIKVTWIGKSKKFPKGYKYKFQFMVFRERWETIARIDNSLHKDKISKMHLHRFERKDIKYLDLMLREVETYIIKLGLKLKKKFSRRK